MYVFVWINNKYNCPNHIVFINDFYKNSFVSSPVFSVTEYERHFLYKAVNTEDSNFTVSYKTVRSHI